MNTKCKARVWCRSAGVALACALWFRSGTARAQEAAPAAPAVAAPPADPESLAADLFQDAEARYAAGDVAGALESMQRSFDVSGRPELWYNLGELHRELHQCSAAAKAYDQYLARATQGRHREEAERARGELRATCPEDAAPVSMPAIPPPPPAPVVRAPSTAPPEPYWTPVRTVAWSSLGAAVVLAAGATYAQVHALDVQGELQDRLRAESATGGVTHGDRALFAAGSHAATWAAVLGVGAVGLAATGVTLLVLNPTSRKPSGAAVSVRVGTGIFVQTSF